MTLDCLIEDDILIAFSKGYGGREENLEGFANEMVESMRVCVSLCLANGRKQRWVGRSVGTGKWRLFFQVW